MNNGFYVLYTALNKICELRKRIKIYSIEYFLGTKIPGIFVIYIQHKYIELTRYLGDTPWGILVRIDLFVSVVR